ncbi:MAG: Gamma-glutamyltranspeptidase [uncultured Corynebacteriales bacterium]|uniref:Gamma-glutamyltranspeptidase n=1 Tax=uncultured Mycobacteriales bacterium TaxID=581187 RepID=A0A6J4JRS9_9ACTN|nr:MAG: Gamma-glutamyltranspeptidase [uncultured Corynebacteriales bacterium]
MGGVVAAGHPDTARAGADVLAAGGTAVDAAVAAVLTSTVVEPMMTGLGGGGYALIQPPGGEPVLLDFFVSAPGLGADPADRAPLVLTEVSWGDAVQVFGAGPPSCGVYGMPAGLAALAERYGTRPLAELAAPAAARARDGVPVTEMQAGMFALMAPILALGEETTAAYLSDGRPPPAGTVLRDPDLADTLDRLGAEGPAPFYTGDVARRVSAHVRAGGGLITEADLAAYEVVEREPVRVRYRDREVLTNPPPNAGGVLLAYALALLDREPAPPDALALVRAMESAQDARDAAFYAGLPEPGFAGRFLSSRVGSTTHVSALDDDGWACSVTCSNGEGSAVLVPGTGLHLNNMLGELDLSPLGYFTTPPGVRLASAMAPTLVRRDGRLELVLGSAGSSRIRSALLQVIVNTVDLGLPVQAAVDAPRLHAEDRLVTIEPGIDGAALAAAGHVVSRFRGRNAFFGGCQAVGYADGGLAGGGDPRRGGAVAQSG